ncbi:hypothetical protein ARALYDRAFT_917382 [Arabidopsis lyrata subsp. lyrata]|uniref:No apical meristem-associated C-terminal domain-containing protein n=1 Tax=Arabidopsis lyrata subsp. lyrata TaxID=81972 RepID=D7MQ15_ARALL|nr:hypothetical protein ARALYDRAFT_917382 [Arabidopsis lyrata subsp. lyrata]
MGTILFAVKTLKSYVIQVENMHPSGASEHDIGIPKFTDNVNIGISNIGNDTVDSTTTQSPKVSSFSINLSSDDGGSNSFQRPIGSKKAKLKRKIDEGNNSFVNTLVSSNEKILDLLRESASTRNKGYEMAQLRMQNQAKKLALKEIEQETKHC